MLNTSGDFLKQVFLLTEPLEEPECISNDQCRPTEICLHRICVNPCTVANPCALSAQCEVTNNKAVCRCPSGLIGDPFIGCYEGIT